MLSRRPGFFSDWRADGRRIAFDFFQPDGDEQIATMKPDGSDLRVITSGPGIHEMPSWSPSGRRIVFGYSPDPSPDAPDFETRLWTMRADGSHARPLPMRRPGFDVEPRYSPNGRWIAFARNRPPTRKRRLPDRDHDRQRQGRPRPAADALGRLPRPADPAGRVPRAPDLVARQPLDPLQHRAQRDDRGDAPERPRPPHDPRGDRGLRRPQALVLARRHAHPLRVREAGHPARAARGQNDDICVMHADGSNIVNLTNTPETWENWPSWGPAPSKHD